jgi:hypothetical protein
MPRSRDWYYKSVSLRIDEIIPPGENVGGMTANENPSLAIEKELDFSAHYVSRTAKIALLYPMIKSDLKHFHGTSVNDVDTRWIIDGNKKITIPCPEDFLRFVSCRMSSWKRDLNEVFEQNDPRYRLQEGNVYTSGSVYKPVGAMVSFGEYEAPELTKWTITYNYTTNQSVVDLDNDFDANIATGQIFTLSNQDDDDENGTYLCNANGIAPTKLSDSITTVNSGTAIECFRAGSINDTLVKFHYIPRLKAEEMPEDQIGRAHV